LTRPFVEVYIPNPRPMDATRARVSSLFEWLIAVVCILGVMAIGATLLRDLSRVTAIAPVIAREEALPDPPATVPPRSVSVPVLLLSGGFAVRVGDTATELSARLGPDAEVAPPTIDRTSSGERVTRFYAQNGQRFAIVLQPLAVGGMVRVAAIYLSTSR
jgi:hypothetical protein